MVQVLEFVVLLEEGFGFEVLKSFEVLLDFSIDYRHFLVKKSIEIQINKQI